MKITLEKTSKIVEIELPGSGKPGQLGNVVVPARIWQGETDDGIPVHCFVTRIALEMRPEDPGYVEAAEKFERELHEVVVPRKPIQAIPMRLIV